MTCGLASHRAQAQSTYEHDQVSVSKNTLLRDGQPWTPHGFFQVAFAVPPGAFGIAGENPVFANAYRNFSTTEYSMMRQAGADSVRINVAQDGADPFNRKYFNPRWLVQFVEAVRAARASGLVVIISIQDETQTGSKTKAPLPDEATRRVWSELAPIFGRDRGVLFELYNEPNVHPGASVEDVPTTADWAEWKTAMDKTLAVVRFLGARNIIVADGLASAQQLSGAPRLEDSLKSVAYGSHPYPLNGKDETSTVWDQKFGDYSSQAPVIVTEWGIGYHCDRDTPEATTAFFNYLDQHHVGLAAVAWDWGPYTFASAIQGFPYSTFSSLLTPTSSIACMAGTEFKPGQGSGPDTSFGPGKSLMSWYVTGKPPTSPE